jgi:hypothetical protein
VRRVKTVGFAIAMALALTAFLGAASASANNFKAQVEPQTWTGSLTGKNHVLFLNEETFTCSGVSFSGETIIKTLSSVTVTPEIGGCSHLGLPTSWAMNGCKLRFRPGAGPSLVGSVDITGCTTAMTNEYFGCVTTIGNQGGIGTVTYKNVATSPPTITAVANLSSLTFTRSGASCAGPKGTFSNGTYTGEWTMKGFSKPGGVPAGVEVESTPPPPPTVFAVEETPATVSGTSSGALKRITAGGALICNTLTLSGSSASASTASLTLTPAFKNCTMAGEAIPDSAVTAGGCSYALHINGKLDIVGATCAANPITITRPECVTTIGPQNGLAGISGLTYTNGGSGKLRTVTIAGSPAEVLTYTAVGAKCFKQGTISEGSIRPFATLSATNSKAEAQGLWVE